MSEDFKPGDFVLSVGMRGVRRSMGPRPVRGEVYIVDRVIQRPEWDYDGIQLADFPNPVDHMVPAEFQSWAAPGFRKIYRPDPKLIERLTAEPLFAPPVKQPGKVAA